MTYRDDYSGGPPDPPATPREKVVGFLMLAVVFVVGVLIVQAVLAAF